MKLLIAGRVWALLAAVLVTVAAVVFARLVNGSEGRASAALNSSRLAGFTVDRPPAGALAPLREFVGCMRARGAWMPEPERWRDHRGRLLIYLPPADRSTRRAYRACDHYRSPMPRPTLAPRNGEQQIPASSVRGLASGALDDMSARDEKER